jgi:antiviral helicase SKI2
MPHPVIRCGSPEPPRRLLVQVGTVIIAAWQSLPPVTNLEAMLTGEARKLLSQFRLTYNMILNLLRTEDMSVEDMIRRSYAESMSQRALGDRNTVAILEKVGGVVVM